MSRPPLPTVLPWDPSAETWTTERCHINELSNGPWDGQLSVALARVEPGVTTRWHRLRGVAERYVVLSGQGLVEIGDAPPRALAPLDVALIPQGCRQRITNPGREDLRFLALCTPRFLPDSYEDVDPAAPDLPGEPLLRAPDAPPWYEALFENCAEGYDREPFTQGTAGECDFIEAELGQDRSRRILDVGCGTGRHAIELARRGYAVEGVDLSEAQLARARAKAAALGLKIPFHRLDARHLTFSGAFDLVLMLCEGAFPLMETDAMNHAILRGAARALKPGGKLILTTLNALHPLRQLGETRPAGFDLMSFRDRSILRVVDDAGRSRELPCDERYYAPSEITWLLGSLGFGRIAIHGARLGAFSRDHLLDPADVEMLVIAET